MTQRRRRRARRTRPSAGRRRLCWERRGLLALHGATGRCRRAMLVTSDASGSGRGGAGRRAPDPDFVLRGHRGDVQALAFHPSLDLLYAG